MRTRSTGAFGPRSDISGIYPIPVDVRGGTRHASDPMSKASIELAPTDIAVPQTYYDVILREDGIVWLRRTSEVFPSIAELHRAYGEYLKVVDDWLLDRRIKSGNLGTKSKTPMAWRTAARR